MCFHASQPQRWPPSPRHKQGRGEVSDKRPPIEPLDYISGVKVVDIGDIRVARGMSRRPASSCKHHHLHYDTAERRIWCRDCETDVEAFDSFKMLVERFHEVQQKLD